MKHDDYISNQNMHNIIRSCDVMRWHTTQLMFFVKTYILPAVALSSSWGDPTIFPFSHLVTRTKGSAQEDPSPLPLYLTVHHDCREMVPILWEQEGNFLFSLFMSGRFHHRNVIARNYWVFVIAG